VQFALIKPDSVKAEIPRSLRRYGTMQEIGPNRPCNRNGRPCCNPRGREGAISHKAVKTLPESIDDVFVKILDLLDHFIVQLLVVFGLLSVLLLGRRLLTLPVGAYEHTARRSLGRASGAQFDF